MSDSINIALRFALYLDLMLLFGLAAFGLYSLRGQERVSGVQLPFAPLLLITAVLGGLLSLAAMACMAWAMSGVSAWAELWPHIEMMVVQTDVGLSWTLRMAALLLAGFAVPLNHRWPSASLGLVTLAGAVALATLAWAGHGAMDEGSRRNWHFITDFLHLWAAGGWVGALAAFALLLRQAEPALAVLARTLTGFETVGAVIVLVIGVTGVVNYLFIVGPSVEGLLDSTYGQLLTLKLILFAAMLVFAALNRFHLSPLLEQARQSGEHGVAVKALRRSMVLEFAVAVVILGLVAWLGTLSPAME
ncbi:putative copper resistance protein D [Pseudomonas sp. NFACC15-1]|uniref:copper homeostasis membrane protein CopD n=1 Tax=unclassified Pseudomonas TaxID=196821 RepID=UPI00088DEEDE|nr:MULTISPECIES: copper homeostasis membrane protein CopD [unclassified Pseudomonas]SDA68290.1 putative copper resistance protein D [Pseudomonas sp. NFACC15-1]SDB05519.1 putative copper resistance protein D [Pseudomonas sp. NFACC13-1]SDX41720.1 putative copper resistance protein D [Pseudomonas sp. NFACC14]